MEITHPGYVRNYSSMVHGVIDPRFPRAKWLATAMTLSDRINFPIYMNLYDIAMMIARKPPEDVTG